MSEEYAGFSYSGGEPPVRGDIVTVAGKNGLNYYSPYLCNVSRNTQYKVKEIRQTPVSSLIKLVSFDGKTDIGGFVRAGHFTLIKRADGNIDYNGQTTVAQFIVIDLTSGSVVKSSTDEKEVTSFMKETIEEDYKRRLALYTFVGLASAEKPKVNFTKFGEITKKEKVKASLFVNSNSPDDFFRKT